MYKTLSAMKERVDFMVNQLTRGNYLTSSTFANNLLHLSRAFEPIHARMAVPGVMELLLREDVLLAADLIATGRAIAMMNNFLVCVTGQGGDGLPGKTTVIL
ncbi:MULTISPECIES: hypothetical protein [Pantoea]|uniref:hypothetical protein n=1 Tax=Pantoea TaxID=53335 RepID=UPI00188F6392|nr:MULTISPECIES: hypothetical protein [Pantoea]MCS3403191.1 hypothetical protein [Pantoea sp. B566]MDN4128517.1 hypothetical protein [Pantoea ananatis]MDN4152820.1 hypothetical protein [Pantoea ananatis]